MLWSIWNIYSKYSFVRNGQRTVEPSVSTLAKECDDKAAEAKTMYKNYQSDLVFLTEEMKVKREEEIRDKETEVVELRRKYFGPEGELFKKRESLMKPIQDDIYNAIKKISEDKGYMMVIDRASSPNIIFASPKIDISNEVLTKLGYSK